MEREEIEQIMDEIGIQYEYYQFEENTISPPYMVWYYGDQNTFAADGAVYYKSDQIIIALCCDTFRRDLEEKIEAVLAQHGLFYEAQREAIEDSMGTIYETVYEMEV